MDHENFGESMRSFITHYSNDNIQSPLPLLMADDPRQLTPVLVEAALCFDERVVPLYDLWSEEVLQEVIDRLDHPGDTAGNKLTPKEWEVLHAEIGCSILSGLNDTEDLKDMEQWLLRDPSAPGLALRSAVSFLQGESERAIEQYEAALKLLSKETGKRNVVIPGIPVLFFALALIQQRHAGAPFERLFTEAVQIEKLHGDDPFTAVLRILGDFIRVACGEIKFKQSTWLTHEPVTDNPWLVLFQGLALYWLDERPGDRQIRRLLRHIDKALKNDLYWYAGEATTLLEMLGVDTDGIDYPFAGEPRQRLVSLYQAKPHWEENLAALNLVTQRYGDGGTEGRDQAASDRRMVWWIQGEGSFVTLEPREQKRNKKGTWTKGRKVALKRLKEELQSFDYLSTADLKICAAIRKDYERNYSYYIETSYELEGEQALRAAIGHPHLYRGDMDGRDSQTVTLEDVSPRLEVIEDRKGETIRIRIHPYPDNSFDFMRDFLCYWVEQHRLQMMKFSDGQLEIAQILTSQGLVAPLSAKEQVLNSITTMAPLVTIHSDIGGGTMGDAEETPADTTPYIHLRPVKHGGELGIETGLQLSLHYKPLGEKGPAFHPGEGRATLFVEIEGQAHKTVRDLNEELVQATQLVDRLQLPATEDPWRWTLDDPEQALEFLLALQGMGDAIEVAWPQGKKLTLTSEIGSSQMQVRIRKQRDWFELNGELQIDEGQVVEMDKLLQLLQQTPGRFQRLDDGRILTLSRQLRRQLDILHAIGDQGKVHPLATAMVEEVTEGMVVKGGKPWCEQIKRLREAESLQPQVPVTLQAELRDYQIDGFCWLTRLAHWGAGACLADDMGLGKTLQALALILQRAPAGPTLVVAPTSVCSNWIDEAERFAPTLRPQRFGSGDRQQMLDAAGPYDLVICSYGLLQSEIERINKMDWQTIVADEAQAFKNANTKRSKAMMSLQGAYRIITTGTPIENHLGELWNLYRFINPGLLGSQARFNERFANPIELHHDDQARLRLKSLIRPFILRRLKSEVLTELPPRTEITHTVEFNDEETVFYESLRRQAMARIAELPEHPGQQRFKVLTEITRLRQAACHPRLVIGNSPVGSAKLRAFVEILEELRENRHRSLVFSQFVRHLALIREYLDQQKIDYQYLDGSTSVKKRKQAVDAFQRGEGELFLISLKAGGSGLNLTAADYVIHMDPWWNPAVEDQASDRTHRMGQTRPVTIYRLVVKGTIEEKIVKLHAHKRDLADGLLEGTDAGVRLSVDDLVDLISGESSGARTP
jgi:superfamily II DNA or RNA helicase